MPITGRFDADFSSFVDAVQNAEVSLKSFTEGGSKVEAQLTRVGNSLSGVTIVQQASIAAEAVDRIGGVSMLTEAELARLGATATEAAAKLKLMGQEVPPGIQAIADAAKNAGDATQSLGTTLSGAFENPRAYVQQLAGTLADDLGISLTGAGLAAVTFGAAAAGAFVLAGKEAYDLAQEAVDLGSSVHDAGLKMSLAAPAVDALRFASVAAGGSIEQMSNLVFIMQQRMDLQPAKFQQGLAAINIDAATFAGLGTDQKVLAISDAMRAAGDNTNRQAAAMDLFGKSGRESLSLVLKPMADLVDQGRALGVMTDAEAQAADDLAVKERILGLEYEHLKTTIGGDLIPPLTFLVDNVKGVAKNFAEGSDDGLLFDATLGKLTSDAHSLSAAWDLLTGQTVELPKVTGDAKKGVDDLDAGIKVLAADGTAAALSPAALKTALSELDAEFKISHTANVQAAKDWDEYTAAGVSAQATVDSLDGAMVEDIQTMLAAGVSAKALGDIYDLNATQMKAIETVRKDGITAMKAEEAESVALTKLWADYYKADGDLYATDVQKAANAAEAKYEIAVAEAQKKGITDVGYYNALWALRQQDASKATVDTAALTTNSIQGLQAVYDKAQATYEAMFTDGLTYTQGQIQHFRDLRDSALANLHDIGTASATTFGGMTSGIGASTAVAGSLTTALGGVAAAVQIVTTDTIALLALSQAGGGKTGDGNTVAPLGAMPGGYTAAQWIAFFKNIGAGDQGLHGYNEFGNSYKEGTGGFVDFGAGTLAMLHGIEAVVPIGASPAASPSLSAAVSGGLGGGSTVINNITFQVSGVIGELTPASATKLGQIAATQIMRTASVGRQFGAA
jgi:hypothetical protein